jgi:hypothetical protein
VGIGGVSDIDVQLRLGKVAQCSGRDASSNRAGATAET